MRGMAWTEEKMEATHGFKAGKWLVCVSVSMCVFRIRTVKSSI